jgi:hypothetical protein
VVDARASGVKREASTAKEGYFRVGVQLGGAIMQTKRQMFLTACLGAGLTGLLAGCSVPRRNIAITTTQFNEVVEEAQNEMLLLNIVRASKRHPMYFTSFGALRGKLSLAVGSGPLVIPFGNVNGGTGANYTIAPSLTYTDSPEFDVAVLDTKKFTCGIMTPVPMKTIEYYWRQGWPKEMLLHLFIGHAVINRETVDNHPDDPVAFRQFQDVIRRYEWDIVPEPNSASNNVIGQVDATDAAKVQSLIEIQKAGLKLTPSGKESRKLLRTSDYVFEVTDRHSGQKSYPTVYQRSPEAILYYLGEILRLECQAQKPDANTPMINISDVPGRSSVPLFHVCCTGPRCKKPFVSVVYGGTRYEIPDDPNYWNRYCADRTMHVLSLVSQLIGLQKEVEQTPVTGVVSVIGR